jgi:hypothetical protein
LSSIRIDFRPALFTADAFIKQWSPLMPLINVTQQRHYSANNKTYA